MAQKRNVSNFTNSNALKTALTAKALYPRLEVENMVYDGAQNDVHLLHGQFDDGWFRTLNIRPSGVTPEFIDPNDDALVRAWTVREVYSYIFQILNNINNITSTLSGNTWTYTIIRNNINYVGTDSNEANAACKALTACVNAL
jgi:hypothetical protein